MERETKSLAALQNWPLLHPALAPLLARTEIRLIANGTALGVHCARTGRLELTPDLASLPLGQVLLRFGLELSWLGGIPGLSWTAAAVLAARTAALFAGLPGVLAEGSFVPPVFAALSEGPPDAASLAEAARHLACAHDRRATLQAADLACIEALWPVALPVECLLASGGDDRLSLDPQSGFNRYGCTPWPRPGVIAFSSCTASSLSPEAFDAAEQARRSLIAESLRTAPSVALSAASDMIASALLAHFGVADLADAVLAASGTDAALVVTGLLAAERPGEMLTSVLMSPSETGSGVPDAVQGRHFASSAAAGCKVGKGQPIDGLPFGPHLVTVALRDATGTPRLQADIAADCAAAIRTGVAHGRVVLHAIDGSKTGMSAPDQPVCSALSATFGDKLDIVVDACQARIEPALVRRVLAAGLPRAGDGLEIFRGPRLLWRCVVPAWAPAQHCQTWPAARGTCTLCEAGRRVRVSPMSRSRAALVCRLARDDSFQPRARGRGRSASCGRGGHTCCADAA